MFKIIATTALALCVLAPTFAFGQLSADQIDSLREVGRQEGWTFEVGENDATKRPLSELCGMKPSLERRPPATMFTSVLSPQQLPTSWDWRDLDGVTPIKNQGGCGSCWAFSAVGALECNIRIRDNVIVDLSEQHLVSCNLHGYNCVDGGWWTHSYHLFDTHPYYDTCECGGYGPVLEADYPYTGHDDPCDCPHPHATQYCLDDWGYIGEQWTIPEVALMKEAIMRYGPISVTVYASSTFQIYDGGVFNACSDQDINHAVVLVGWDDTMGENGVWIMRNSWGPSWGENGYMYIEYGCSRIGYNATFVDYGLPDVILWSDTTYGPVPLDVNFGAYAGHLAVDTWSWDFGDGGTAAVQSPSYTFEQRGTYDISATATAGGEVYSATRPMYIVAYNDTIRSHDVVGVPGSQVVITLSTYNSGPVRYFKIPVEFNTGDFLPTYDSFSTVGCRTDYFEQQSYLHYDPWFNRRLTLKLVSSDIGTSPELPPGDGPIVKLYFTIPESAAEGQTAQVMLDGYDIYSAEFQGSRAQYGVATQNLTVTCSEACCQNRGDFDHDGALEETDIVLFVEWLWAEGPNPACQPEIDVDGDGQIDPTDLMLLVEYIWGTGQAPNGCQ